MEAHHSSRGRFVLFCEPERQPRYLDAIDATPHAVALASNLVDVLNECLVEPPDALVIDLVTGIKARADALSVMLHLDMAWPIVRSSPQTASSIAVISTDPPSAGAFDEALDAIARGDPDWHREGYRRRYVRLPIRCRARFRERYSPTWHKGTTLDLHTRGCFLLTYEPLDIGIELELELLDLGEKLLTLDGKIAWTRSWEESVLLPGMGVEFDTTSAPAALLRRLVDPTALARLLS